MIWLFAGAMAIVLLLHLVAAIQSIMPSKEDK
jgi:hypothetical protein